MTEYINKDFYKQIPANERHFIKLSQEAAYAAVKEFEAANIPYSATISEYRSIVTVNTADKERAEKIAENSAKAFPNVRTVLGNTEFKYIRDKKYIDTDADTARKIADILSGNANNRFSGIIRGEKATITVSGDKNAAAVRAMIDNLKNMDLLQALRERGFERIPDTNGFVNIRSVETGEVCGFNSMAAVRDMLDNPENEFFYPLSYRIAYREHPTNGDYYYCILKYSPADKSTAKVYRDENNKPPIFKSVDEALSYTASNAVEITNIDEEIANWRELDREREDNSIIEENRKLIEKFPVSGENYIDLVSYNPNNDTFSWTYYNPDGDNGNGAFIDKTVTKDDIFAAYSVRIAAENEEQGRNAFIAYLNEHCKENVIELYSGYFHDYADDYINYSSRNFAYYFGISENSKATMSVDSFITHFEINCDEVIKDKERREQMQKITERSFRVEFDGYSGAYNVIDNAEIDGRELFMLENDYYGDSLAHIVADKDGNIIDDNVWGDFEEYENTLVRRGLIENAERTEGGTTMPVLQVFAEDMNMYGFDVSEDNGVFTVNKKDIASYVRMYTIAEILYDISEKYRFEPNEVGNNHLLDLNRFYDSYDWDGFSMGKNVLENTIIALQSGNFEPIENYIEQVKSVCENSSDLMQYEKSKIAEVEEHLDKIKAAFVGKSKTEIEVPNGDLSESTIHFGYFGNGVLCYDTSKIDKEIDDYRSVAHISSEGNIRYYVDDLSDSDKKHIENHAKGVKERFTAYWNSLSLQTRYGMLYDKLLDTANFEQIRAFENDHFTDTSEKVKKYEHSLIFKDEDFPFKNSPAVDFKTEVNSFENDMQTQTNNDDFEIYQVKSGDEYFFKRFVDLSTLGGSPDMSDYDLVYSGKLSEINVTAENKDDILENIYTKFNNDHPDDFTGHSLSVSDIVVLHTDGTDTAHYVDDIGFKDVPDFLTEKTREQPHIHFEENLETENENLVVEKAAAEKFREITRTKFNAIDGSNSDTIEKMVSEYISEVLSENEIEAELGEVVLYGSRSRGLENDNSDIDIVVQIKSDLKEDALFNILNESEYTVGGINVDINPIRSEETGTLENYLLSAEKYLETKDQFALRNDRTYIYSEITFETGEIYLVPGTVTDDNISETAAYKEIFERYADRENIESLDDMLRVNIQTYSYGSGEEYVLSDNEMDFIRENSIGILNQSEEIGNTEFFVHFWKNVDDILDELDSKATEQHRTSPKLGDGYEERTYIFPSDYSSDYPDNYSAVSQIKIGSEWLDTEEAVKNMNARGNTDTAQIEALRVRTVSFDGVERNEEMSPEAFHIILDRTNNNRDKLKAAAELNAKGDIMPFYTKTLAEATEAGERGIYFDDRRENQKCASSIDYSISCNNDGMHFNSDKSISDLLNTYSLDRIILIIAARVSDAGEWDRRFSRDNIEWAKGVVKDYPAEQVEAISRLGLKSHSVLLDAAADELRKNYEMFREMQKPKETDVKAETEQLIFVDNIKNLSQLKRTLTVGTEFVITDHKRKECIGERRRVTEANTACFYSQKIDENGNAQGKPLYMEWGKAKNWNFDNGICTSALENKETVMSFKIYDDVFLGVDTAEIRRKLAERGMIGDEVVDEEKFNNSPFMKQFMQDVENAVRSESNIYVGGDAPTEDLTEERHINAEDITKGDKFIFNGEEVTVSSFKGIYPNDVGISKIKKSGWFQFEAISNVNKFKLAREGIYLGNTEKPVQRENAATEEKSPMGTYSPKINDVVENADGVYKVAQISEKFVTLLAADTLLPDEKMLSMSDFYKSNFNLIARDEAMSETTNTETPIEEAKRTVKKAENYAISDKTYGEVGGAKSRYAANIEAIKALKKIEAEERTATAEEQAVIAKYTGWGAIPQAFDSANDKWSNEYAELKEILTPEEYEAARHSTMNAHYTSPTVIAAMYDVLNDLGFENGKILEPAMGTGNFFGMLPKIYKDSKLYGVELDSITGRIAQQLYPNADIQIKGYENTSFNDNSFDVAIGNVPFGDYKVSDKRYNDSNFNIHDYFFAKTLDKVHAGGIIAFVTSKGTMDKENDEIRRYIAERAELLGAVRLPNNAFKATAGTEVTSDILILQKRERSIEVNPDSIEWLKKSETADGLSVNNYFVQHPEMVLGKIVEGNKLYGHSAKDTSCIPIEGADLKQQLAEAVKNIKGTYKAAEVEIEPQNDDNVPAPANSRKFAFYVHDGKIYYREGEDTMKKVNVSKDIFNRAMGMIELRDAVHKLLNLQLENSNGRLDDKVAESRKKLNTLYDSFVAKYGNISTPKNAKAFKGDNGYAILSALETKDENGKVIGKADIFTKNTLKPKVIAAHVETAEEALILSVSEKAKVDFDFMTQLCGMDKDKLISELEGQIYKLPQETEKYVTADEYLSGNIRKKMKDIENCPNPQEYEKNYKALEAAMPPRIEAKDISVKLGSHWVDPKYIRQFIIEKFNPDARTESELNVSYSKVAGAWKIEGQTATAKKNHTATSTYGTYRKNAYEIIEGILNNSDLVVKDRKKDEFGVEMRDKNGNYILVTNEEETKAARHCANIIKSEFVDWIFKDPDRREELVNKYNEIFNSFRYREYDGTHLNFVGMNTDITLKEHQKNAIARGLYGGNTLLAHAVGAGKTYEMIAIAMEGKRLGLHNKSLFAVPNALTEQIGNDFRKLYPNANILVATKKDFEKQNRAKLLAKMATNDWDAVIVGHSQFDRMGLSAERESEYLHSEINKLRDELERIKSADRNAKKSFTVKQIEKTITNYTKRLEDLADKQVKDDFIDFEQLGFDKIFVDECHNYKNLATATKMRNVAGLGSRGSARAFNLLMKAKYLDELTDGKGCVFASGTPVSNSMTELYTLMRYLQADTLKDLGINHFDEWAADFGEVITDYELKPESDGKYQLKTRFAKFTNLPELMSIFKQAADIRTADTLDLEKPKAIVQEILAKPSKYQKRQIKYLGERAADIRLGGVDPRIDNMLCVTNDGRKIGLDARLFIPHLPDDPNSKVNMCVQNVFDIYTQTADRRSTQCIFCDLSTPKTESRQDRFAIYRPNEETDIGYEVIRKKNGIKKETDFKAIKDYIGKNSDEEEDKLRDGDIAVIRRPNEDRTKIISEAAIYENGKFNTVHSVDLLEKLEMSPIEDMPPKEFNIYDDIKNKLMERGVAEKEIAFIHDYDTPEQKQGLFNKMNAGEVRILLGSTSKCGAGMNAQKKMIALHHLDAPMRPSDVDPT